MSVSKTTGDQITLSEAAALTSGYQEMYPTMNKAYFMGSESIQQILNQQNCIGIRIYNGYDSETQKSTVVLVGVNGEQKDMTAGVIMDRAIPCPSACDSTSALM